MKIVLQAGHENIKNNCDTALRGSTGAGGEVEINIAVRNTTAELLEKAGVNVKKVDANFNCEKTSADEDYDLFLAIHCDMDYPDDKGSGFCDFPEPSTDGATERSQYLAKTIQDYFFPAVGINIKSRSNANTRYFYMWKHLSLKTPCVLIEMGQVKDAHDSVILKDTEKVSKALANAILQALGLQDEKDLKIEKLQKELDEMRESRNDWRTRYKQLEKEYEKEVQELRIHRDLLQKDLSEANARIEVLEKAIMTNKTPLSAYSIKERFQSIVHSLLNGGDFNA